MTSSGHSTGAVPESWLKERLTTTDAHELANYELAGSGLSVPDLQKLVIAARWLFNRLALTITAGMQRKMFVTTMQAAVMTSMVRYTRLDSRVKFA